MSSLDDVEHGVLVIVQGMYPVPGDARRVHLLKRLMDVLKDEVLTHGKAQPLPCPQRQSPAADATGIDCDRGPSTSRAGSD